MYAGILDIENHNQQTPFFVAIIKGFLDIAELMAVDQMSSVEARDIVSYFSNIQIERRLTFTLGCYAWK